VKGVCREKSLRKRRQREAKPEVGNDSSGKTW